MAGGLAGIRVVELATWVASPGAGAMLADWGAEVIHVEHPVRGDALRGYVTKGGGHSPSSKINYLWELTNRNKKCLTLDVSQPEGLAVMHKLIASADVFSSNLRPHDLERMNLDYRTLAEVNPRLIFTNVTGYGPKGPDGNSPGFDFAAFWSRSGMMQMFTEPGATPPGPRPAFGDNIASLAVSSAILLGLLIRERTGTAQALDVSLLHTAFWALSWDLQYALVSGQDIQKTPRTDVNNPLSNYYQTKDQRWLTITLTPPDRYWHQFCLAIERQDLEHDARYNSFDARLERHRELIQLLDGVFATRTRQEWKERLDAHGLVWSPVQTITEAIRDPQALANEYFVPFDHPSYGKLNLIASPVKLSKTPASIESKAPDFGEHNEDILLDLGYDWDAIVALRDHGIIS